MQPSSDDLPWCFTESSGLVGAQAGSGCDHVGRFSRRGARRTLTQQLACGLHSAYPRFVELTIVNDDTFYAHAGTGADATALSSFDLIQRLARAHVLANPRLLERLA